MSTDLEVQGPANPLQLIQLALEKGLDPEKLYGLAERWQQQEAARAYNVAMNRCQQAIPPVVKSQPGDKGAHYAKIEHVLKTARPIILENGFSLSTDTTDSHLPDHYRIVLHVSHVGGETRTHHLDLPADTAGAKGTPNKSHVQGVLSSFSYGERVLICKAFCIVLEGLDQDGKMFVSTINDQQLEDLKAALAAKGRTHVQLLQWASERTGTKIVALERFPAVLLDEAMRFLKPKNGGAK